MKKLILLAIVILLMGNSCKKEIDYKPGYNKPTSETPSNPNRANHGKPNVIDPK